MCNQLTGAAALPHRVRQQTELSLKLLKMSYVDLLLIHFPIAFEVSLSTLFAPQHFVLLHRIFIIALAESFLILKHFS